MALSLNNSKLKASLHCRFQNRPVHSINIEKIIVF
jgi:hypothetical protein